MRKRELESYVRKNLPAELRVVQTGPRATALPELSSAEKALIYHYTSGGYEVLNASLHSNLSTNSSLLGQGLAAALTKLPPHEGLVFSGIWLRPTELVFYRACARSGHPVHWPAFLSASLKAAVALQFLRTANKNCLFVIQSKTSRLIEAVAEHGLHGQVPGQNEAEVLFAPQTSFDVLEVADETDYTRIVLDELSH